MPRLVSRLEVTMQSIPALRALSAACSELVRPSRAGLRTSRSTAANSMAFSMLSRLHADSSAAIGIEVAPRNSRSSSTLWLGLLGVLDPESFESLQRASRRFDRPGAVAIDPKSDLVAVAVADVRERFYTPVDTVVSDFQLEAAIAVGADGAIDCGASDVCIRSVDHRVDSQRNGAARAACEGTREVFAADTCDPIERGRFDPGSKIVRDLVAQWSGRIERGDRPGDLVAEKRNASGDRACLGPSRPRPGAISPYPRCSPSPISTTTEQCSATVPFARHKGTR